MSLAHVNGIELYHEEAGTGPALLLLNGMGGNTLGWTPLLPALSAHFGVVAFDARGAGRSSAPPGPYTIGQLADDAAGLLDHLGIARAHVVGHEDDVAHLVGERVARDRLRDLGEDLQRLAVEVGRPLERGPQRGERALRVARGQRFASAVEVRALAQSPSSRVLIVTSSSRCCPLPSASATRTT